MKQERSKIMLIIIFMIIGIVIGFGISLFASFTSGAGISKEAASDKLKELYSLNEINVDNLLVQEESGMYRFFLKSGTTALDAWMTKDGKLLFQSGINVGNFTEQLKSRKNWFDCLRNKGFRFFGSTEINTSIAQIQLLGGTLYLDKIYISCDGTARQSCIDAGIQSVPTFLYENKTYSRILTIQDIGNLTSCKFA